MRGTGYTLDCGDHCFKVPKDYTVTGATSCPITKWRIVAAGDTAVDAALTAEGYVKDGMAFSGVYFFIFI